MAVCLRYLFLIVVLLGFGSLTCYQYQLADKIVVLTEENHDHSEENESNSNPVHKEIKYISNSASNFQLWYEFRNIEKSELPQSLIGILISTELYSPPEIL